MFNFVLINIGNFFKQNKVAFSKLVTFFIALRNILVKTKTWHRMMIETDTRYQFVHSVCMCASLLEVSRRSF